MTTYQKAIISILSFLSIVSKFQTVFRSYLQRRTSQAGPSGQPTGKRNKPSYPASSASSVAAEVCTVVARTVHRLPRPPSAASDIECWPSSSLPCCKYKTQPSTLYSAFETSIIDCSVNNSVDPIDIPILSSSHLVISSHANVIHTAPATFTVLHVATTIAAVRKLDHQWLLAS